MADIKIGDHIFDENGQVCRVTFVSIPEVAQDAYRITFSDGAQIDACADHQWVTWTHAERKALLRSPYEDKTTFPANWVTWRLKRLVGGMYLSRPVVSEALEMYGEGASIRGVAKNLGIARNAITPHLKAKGYIEREPKIYEDSPGPQIRTTKKIAESLTYGGRGDRNHCIPNCRPLELPYAHLPVPPYVFGYWLGDGSSTEASITISDEDLPALSAKLAECGLKIIKSRRRNENAKCSTNAIRFDDDSSLYMKLKELGVIRNKRIPGLYLRASAQQRMELLSGLMDSDGGVEQASYCSLTSKHKGLADDVYELAVSLGIRVHRDTKIAFCNEKNCGEVYRVAFTPPFQIFSLPRKAKQIAFDSGQQLRRNHRMIVSVERIQPKLMRCISVDSPNRMYLASEAMIPTHNTRVLVEWAKEQARLMPGSHGAIVAATAADTRDVLAEGPAGFIATSPQDDMPLYEPSKRRITWVNGTTATFYSADEPNRLRGPQHHWAICDEYATWRYPETLDMLMFGLRLGRDPRVVIATTPRPTKEIKELLLQPGLVVTRGTTYENLDNLAPAFREQIITRYEGTRLGRQELDAEILEDVEGALWTRQTIEDNRVRNHPGLARIVVAIDPAASSKKKSNMTGIVTCGKDENGIGYVLEDVTLRGQPDEWARAAIAAYHRWQADRIIAEDNQGGEMVADVIKTRDENIAIDLIHASRDKYLRADPISALYTQGKIKHVGSFPELEDQMASWLPGDESPDRLDAMVHGMTALALTNDWTMA